VATPIPPNRAELSVAEVVAATRGALTGAAAGESAVRGFTTDSRAVAAGGCFVALRGERSDGHEHVGKAIEAGARLVLVERGRAPAGSPDGVAVVQVDDTLVSWGDLAHAHLAKWRSARTDARVIAITGSAGKTTTKEITAALLRPSADIHATAGNLNNRIGVPAVVLGLEPGHRIAVLEMGMSVPGEIAALGAIAVPDVAIVTNVGLAHAGGVGGSVADVAREKGALFAALGPEGVAVANADDPQVMAQARDRHRGPVVTFGRAEGAAVRLTRRDSLGPEGSRVYVHRAGDEGAYVLPIPGEAAALDFVAALAAADAALGATLPDSAVASALRHLEPAAGRLRPRRLKGGIYVLDDSYNANPASVRAAFDALAELKAQRRVAVLGEMKELGSAAETEHEKLGEDVARAGIALLVSCGGLADLTARAAERRGVDVVLAGDAAKASVVAVERVRSGDVVLVKASRSVGAERVVDGLVAACGLEESA
jgi:UDP-N-acetylmuramoyl-tripeptide--D-alanyl-D-alanine ligase